MVSDLRNKRKAGCPTEPVGDRLYMSIKDLVVSHALKNLRKFPTERELCTQFSVSRGTVRTALKKIEDEGLLIRRAGDGAYLSPKGLSGFREMHDMASDSSQVSMMEKEKLPLRLGSFEYPDVHMKIWKKLFSEFRISRPGIELKPEKTDAIQAASFYEPSIMPDVFNVNSSDIRILASRGLLLDLSSLEEDLCVTDFIPGALDECKVNGKLYAVPQEMNLGVMFCNAGLLEKLDVEIDDTRWSWDQALDIMRRCIAEHRGNISGMNFPAAYNFMIYFGVLHCDRPFISDEYGRNHSNAQKMLEWFREALSSDNILFRSGDVDGDENSLKKFLAGEMLFYFHGTSLNIYLKKFCHFPIKALAPPFGNGAAGHKVMVAWCASSRTLLPLTCMEWLKFVSGSTGMEAVASKDGNPPAWAAGIAQSVFAPRILEYQLSSGAFHRLPTSMQKILEFEVWRPAISRFANGETTVLETLEQIKSKHKKIEYIYRDNKLIFGG